MCRTNCRPKAFLSYRNVPLFRLLASSHAAHSAHTIAAAWAGGVKATIIIKGNAYFASSPPPPPPSFENPLARSLSTPLSFVPTYSPFRSARPPPPPPRARAFPPWKYRATFSLILCTPCVQQWVYIVLLSLLLYRSGIGGGGGGGTVIASSRIIAVGAQQLAYLPVFDELRVSEPVPCILIYYTNRDAYHRYQLCHCALYRVTDLVFPCRITTA